MPWSRGKSRSLSSMYPVAVRMSPLARQRPDVFRRDARLSLLPFRRLGDSVFFAKDVVAPLLKSHSSLGDVLLVVEFLRDPHVGDRQHHRAVGARPRRKPLSSKPCGRVVVIWIDVNEFDAEFL